MGREARRKKDSLTQMRSVPLTSERSIKDYVKAIAMHEAGHIVFALISGLKVDYAIINLSRTKKDGGPWVECSGGTQLDRGSCQQTRDTLTPEVLRVRTGLLVAGRIAESMVGAHAPDAAVRARVDEDEAIKLAFFATGSPAPEDTVRVGAYLDGCAQEALAVLNDHKPALTAVANYLLQHLNEKVSGSALEALCCRRSCVPDMQKGRA